MTFSILLVLRHMFTVQPPPLAAAVAAAPPPYGSSPMYLVNDTRHSSSRGQTDLVDHTSRYPNRERSP
ncbi:hypothetical protein M0804_014313 [Polistes exclamans]|nr:hypothetical protein M0804_014317 [Polistes exclamans]KAI4475439.1 hypothetical protein M0804_014313 [Polistes exclamans]